SCPVCASGLIGGCMVTFRRRDAHCAPSVVRGWYFYSGGGFGLDSAIVKIAFDHPAVDLSESFKAYDVRGIENITINADVALAVGFAFVEVTGATEVLV